MQLPEPYTKTNYINMKTITCIDCEEQFSGGSVDEVMKNMHPHYMEQHQDVMADATPEKRDAWMKELNQRFENAE